MMVCQPPEEEGFFFCFSLFFTLLLGGARLSYVMIRTGARFWLTMTIMSNRFTARSDVGVRYAVRAQ